MAEDEALGLEAAMDLAEEIRLVAVVELVEDTADTVGDMVDMATAILTVGRANERRLWSIFRMKGL